MRNRNSRSDLFEERAVVALMEHLDPPPAASALGVSLRTLTRCMDKPAFQAARLRAAERAHTLQQRIRLAQGLGPVVRSAATIVLNGKNPARASAGGPAHRNHRPGGRRNRRLRGGGGAGATTGRPGRQTRRPQQADRRARHDTRPGCRANNNRRSPNCCPGAVSPKPPSRPGPAPARFIGGSGNRHSWPP
jgi:hypothetical protein